MPASSCSRVRTSRDRHSCSSLALASSDSRAAAPCGRIPAVLRAMQRLRRARALGPAPFELDAELPRFEVRDAISRRRPARVARGRIMRARQRRDGVEHGVDVGARLLDILLERLDRHPRARVFLRRRCRQCRSPVASGGGFGRGQAPAFERDPLRFAARLELHAFLLELLGALLQHLGLLRIERDLLLAAIDLELVRVHARAPAVAAASAVASSMRMRPSSFSHFGEARRCRRFVRARFVQSRARRFDRFRQAAIRARRTAPFPSAASHRGAACSAGAFAAWRFNDPRCLSIS
jgi:hypothetical protein